MTKQTAHKKGFTLIELALFMGMFSFILLVLMQIFTALMDKQVEIETMSAVQSDRSFILTRLTYDIARADTISMPANPGDQGSTLSFTVDGQTFSYGLNDSNLILTTVSGTATMNSIRTTLPSLTFERLGNSGGKNTIRVAYTVESTVDTPQGHEIKSVDTTLGTR